MQQPMLVYLAIAAIVTIACVAAILRIRARKRVKPRVVELPNSAYTPKLVLDRDTKDYWQLIPVDQLHEINREEVVRLLERVAAAGVDSLNLREREFLDNLAERYLRDVPRRPGSTVKEFSPRTGVSRHGPPSSSQGTRELPESW